MRGIRNDYQPVTDSVADSNDMVELNGKYTAVRFDSMEGDEKWAINKGDIPIFHGFGVLPNVDDAVIGKYKGSFYLIRMQNNPRPVCQVKSYRAFESDEIMWVSGGRGELNNPIISRRGEFLVHLPTGKYTECSEPPEMVEFRSKYKLSDGTIIEWTGAGFESKESGVVSETENQEGFDIKDARKDELEEFLKNNVDMDIISGASNMDEVDLSDTPRPMVDVFYEMGEGDFPEDPDGDFEPPGQDEFAENGYRLFKTLSEYDGDKSDDPFREENRMAWIKRLKNAWASLVRDVHFSFMMYEEQSQSECFDKVKFDKELDVEQGIDFLIENDGTEYHINLFIDSRKSRRFLSEKKKYRHPDTDAVAVEVPMEFGGEMKSLDTEGSELWLYNEEHVDAVKQVVFDDADEVTDGTNTLCKKIGEVN